MPDLPHAEHLASVRFCTSDAEIDRRAGLLRPAGRFRRGKGRWEPEKVYGVTVTTLPAGEDVRNRAAYQAVRALRNTLLRRIGRETYAPPNSASHHVTVCDISSGKDYERAITLGTHVALWQRLSALACGLAFASRRPVTFRFRGLTLFTSALVAVCSVDEKLEYDNLIELRHHVYADARLRELGVTQEYALLPHCTLAYVEGTPDVGSAMTLATAIKKINRRCFTTPPSLTVETAESRIFHDLNKFYRAPIAATFHFT